MESYLQAVGRGERDGSDVLSIMFYRAYHLCYCDPTMRAFVKNKVKCRHVETFAQKIFFALHVTLTMLLGLVSCNFSVRSRKK